MKSFANGGSGAILGLDPSVGKEAQMPISDDSASTERLRMGPVKVVQVFTSPSSGDAPVTEKLGYDFVPFSEYKHLCSGKPLSRYEPEQERC